MFKYPELSTAMARRCAKAAMKLDDEKARAYVGILHNMVRGAEDPNEDKSHRRWCAGQASVISAGLNARFPR